MTFRFDQFDAAGDFPWFSFPSNAHSTGSPGDDGRPPSSGGTGLDLHKVWQAGLPGVAMGIAVVVLTGIPLFFADRLVGGNGVAGAAAKSATIIVAKAWVARRVAAGPAGVGDAAGAAGVVGEKA